MWERKNPGISSKSSPLLNWCDHEGDGYASFPSNYDDDNTDVSTSELISITEAAKGKYEFKVTHKFNQNELYYPTDHLIVGKLHVWITGEDENIFVQDVNEDRDTHRNDELINPEFDESYYVDVSCDDACECTFTKVQDKFCEIDVKVMFPEDINANYYAYHND